jgi:hypothetical protein
LGDTLYPNHNTCFKILPDFGFSVAAMVSGTTASTTEKENYIEARKIYV